MLRRDHVHDTHHSRTSCVRFVYVFVSIQSKDTVYHTELLYIILEVYYEPGKGKLDRPNGQGRRSDLDRDLDRSTCRDRAVANLPSAASIERDGHVGRVNMMPGYLRRFLGPECVSEPLLRA